MSRSHSRMGASRNANANKNILEKFSLAKFLLVSSLIVLALVIYGSLTAVQTVLEVPVSQVDVEGKFHYLTENDVNQVIGNYVDNGFVTVDLLRLKEEFLALPWVHSASIRRKLPNGLRVSLVEQRPVAYWNERGMLNDQGDEFYPVRLPVIPELPHLKGKNHSAVLFLFRAVSDRLPPDQQPVRSIAITDSNLATVEVAQGARLVFNAADVLEKLQMWETISGSDLGLRLAEVDYVDLRYSNGAAVKWKKNQAEHAEKKSGVR